MIYSIKTEDELKDLGEVEDLQSKVKQVRLVEKLTKQGFPNNIKELKELFTKEVTHSNQKPFEEAKNKTKAITGLNESNVQIKI